MYKRAIFIFILIFTSIMCVFTFGAYAEDEIRLFVDGVETESDVAPFISNDRTLVPVRCIFEAFNAEVSWDNSAKQVTINTSDNAIVLTINSLTAYVNGEPIFLDVPPVIKNDRAFVPIRFISEKLGCTVEWDGAERTVNISSPASAEEYMTVTSVSAEKSDGGSVVTVKGDNFAKPSISTASSPARYILDFEGALLSGGDSKIKVGGNDITEVRYAQHDGYVRVVIESPGTAEYSCEYYDGYMTVTVVGKVSSSKTDTNNPIIVIDAGHGGHDTGAIGYGDDGSVILRECDANLEIAQGVKYYLEKNSYTVIMTRDSDVAFADTEMEDLLKRCEIANDAEATFFVSIHNNSFSDSSASGTMVLYADTDNKSYNGVTSKELAQNILTPLVESMQLLNRGVVDSPKMVVLRKTNMPSVLIECGFVSCPTDRAILTDDSRIDSIAEAIAEGIIKSVSNLS